MILSIIVIVFVLLAAYWWGNAGAFDALMHLVCVVAAGLIAVAVWEPLNAIAFLGGGFSEFGWGVTLGGTFLVALLLLRLVSDIASPTRPRLPRWAEWAVGVPLGAVSGLFTIGLLLIAAGHMSMKRELLGYEGMHRRVGAGKIEQHEARSPVTMSMRFAAGMLNFASSGSMRPSFGKASLARWRPDIAGDGGSLLRDSLEGGQGRLAVGPAGVSVVGTWFDPAFALESGPGAYAVLLSVKRPAYDTGGGFSLSASQARLIDGGTGRSAFPAEFSNGTEESGESLVRGVFSGDATYLATPGSTQESFACLLFSASELSRKPGSPLFLQLKGLRFDLGEPKTDSAEMAKAVTTAGMDVALEIPEGTDAVSVAELRVENRLLQGLMLDANDLPGTLRQRESKLIGGAGTKITKPQGAKTYVRALDDSKDQRVVLLTCTKGSTVDLFNARPDRRDAEAAGMQSVPMLRDSNGSLYAPVGYMWNGPTTDEYEVFLEPPALGFPLTLEYLSRARNGGELELIYRVPAGRTITVVLFSDPQRSLKEARVVGTAKLKVEGPG